LSINSTFKGTFPDVGCAAKAVIGAFNIVQVFKFVCGTARAVAANKINWLIDEDFLFCIH
jgi:hypothetical protein